MATAKPADTATDTATGDDITDATATNSLPPEREFTTDQYQACVDSLTRLDVALREHGVTLAQILAKTSHNVYGIVISPEPPPVEATTDA
jgi:hypothetical protein